jgi:hypothetical protein
MRLSDIAIVIVYNRGRDRCAFASRRHGREVRTSAS